MEVNLTNVGSVIVVAVCGHNRFYAVIFILVFLVNNAVWKITARQLAKCECKMILASISIQVLAILASWHVCAKYDNLLLDRIILHSHLASWRAVVSHTGRRLKCEKLTTVMAKAHIAFGKAS
jgi:hypothetical protein